MIFLWNQEDFMHQKIKFFGGGGHLGSHDLEIRSQGHVNKFFLKDLIVVLNNQEVFWAQNHPENCSKIYPKTLRNASVSQVGSGSRSKGLISK
jgi:hypothetical protein